MSTVRVAIEPKLITWARERARYGIADLEKKFPKLADWESGAVQPTFRQLEDFAAAVHVPFGYLFLEMPPVETLPLSDFRTPRSESLRRPSPELIDTVYQCLDRQRWYAEHARGMGQEPLPFVGGATTADPPETVAANIRATLHFEFENRQLDSNTGDALKDFIAKAEAAGILVMVSSYAGNSTRRKLKVEEFRGFALCDPYAPLVFINGSDATTAQMFTLAHELAHIWLGASALSDLDGQPPQGVAQEELWCNRVAAEVLMPAETMKQFLIPGEELNPRIERLKKAFKVSKLVVLRRLLDLREINQDTFWRYWQAETKAYEEKKEQQKRSGGGGPDFYQTLPKRVSKLFLRELVISALEGQTSFSDAFRLIGVKSLTQLKQAGEKVGIDG